MTDPVSDARALAEEILARDLLNPLWPGLTESEWAHDAKALAKALLVIPSLTRIARLSEDAGILSGGLLATWKRERACPFCGACQPPCAHVSAAQRIRNTVA